MTAPAVTTERSVEQGSRRREPAGTLTGTWTLARLQLRLDRVRTPLWLVGIVTLVLVSAASVAGLYPEPEDVQRYVATMELSPNLVSVNRALNGPGLGFDDPNLGVVLVNELAIWGAFAFALMGIFAVTRHTRAEEDAERADVVRARSVGRHASLAAVAVTVTGTQLLAGLVSFAGLLALGFAPVGSTALCAAFVAAGLVFAAITAVAAQVASTARATLGLGLAALGVAYLVRATGDLGQRGWSWASPIGWTHQVRAFAGERWWVLGLSFGVVAVCGVLATSLADRRDLGSGLVSQRLGPAHASRWSTVPIGLVLRLQRGAIVGWSIGLLVLGLAYGAVGSDIEQVLRDNPDMEQFIPAAGRSITDSYVAYTLALGAMLAGGYAIGSVLRLRGEEVDARTEWVLATPSSRWTWMDANLAVAVSGSVLVLVASGLGTGLGLGVATDDLGQVPRLVGASLSLLPAVLVLVGVAALAYGWAPRWSMFAWGPLAFVVVVGLFGELFRVPMALRWLSPLEHLPMVPAEAVEPVPAVVLTGLAGVLVAAAGVGFRSRDVPAL